MATLDELRGKWFIRPGPTDPGLPPLLRHPGSTVADWTDGNDVVLLTDGASYMETWYGAVTDLTTKGGGEILHSGWRFEAVRTLGWSHPDSDALALLSAAAGAGVSVYVLLSRHGFGIPSALNLATVAWLRTHGVSNAALDSRFPRPGSNHQKAVVFKHPSGSSAVLGSIDIAKTRWDTPNHAFVDSERDHDWGKQTHDTGVRLKGPAVADIEKCFRERWNDGSRSFGMEVPNSNAALPLISSAEAAGATAGSCSVQTLRTYGITTADRGYSWSPTGEFTFWAAYLRAIKTASNYIYIEDQYFLAAGAPPLCLSTPDTTPIPPNPKRDVDLIYQLGAALKRGVKVVIVTPSNAEDIVHAVIKYQRDLGLEYLYERDAGAGNLVVASLEQGRGPVYVHSKLLVVDDEFVIIGSGNVGQRSVSCDGELSIGVVDEAEQFARTVRTTMWAEHLRLQPGDVTDVDATMDLFRRNQGRIRPYPYATPSKRPTQYVNLLTQVVDPYYGPPDLSPI